MEFFIAYYFFIRKFSNTFDFMKGLLVTIAFMGLAAGVVYVYDRLAHRDRYRRPNLDETEKKIS